MKRAEILDTAKEYVTKDRAATHGQAEDSFTLIAEYWSVYLQNPITSYDVAVLMVLFKVARMQGNPTHLDSATDACGYAALAGEIAVRG